MARSRTKPKSKDKGKNTKGPKVKFTRSAEERNVGGSQMFLRLNDEEKFIGYALFNPDPSAEDNDGYVEYGEHWDAKASRFVPCWGEKNGCIFCKAGAQASQRALAAFLVTSINGNELDEPEIKLFRMNWLTIQEWTDTLDEDGATLGQKVRIKCQSKSDGDFLTKFYDKDKLTKKDLTAALKDVPEIEEILQKNLNRALEALRVEDVLESDDDEDDEDIDDEEEETPKSKSKSKSNKKKKDEEEDEDEDEDDEEEEEDEDDSDDDDSDDEDDDEEDSDDEDDEDDDSDEDEEDEDEDEEDEDSDDEDSDDDDDEDEEAEDEDSEGESIEGEFTIVSVSESEMTFTLKELENDIYVGADIAEDVDFDEFKKGDKVRIVATQDDDEDYVATEISKIEKSKPKSKGKDKKDTKKSGKKK